MLAKVLSIEDVTGYKILTAINQISNKDGVSGALATNE